MSQVLVLQNHALPGGAESSAVDSNYSNGESEDILLPMCDGQVTKWKSFDYCGLSRWRNNFARFSMLARHPFSAAKRNSHILVTKT
jgi:hypothetical protein